MSFLTSRQPTLSILRSTCALRPTLTQRRNLARMTIVGRLGDSPDIVPTATGQDVIRYALATSHGPRDNRQTSWWKVACFAPEGGLRDLVMGLGKGSMIYIEGDCSMTRFTGKDGVERGGLNIVQKNIEVLERKDQQTEDTESPEAASAAGR